MSRAVMHGVRSAPEYLPMLQHSCVPADRIAVPTLVTAQPGDAETRRLYEAISSPKVLAEFEPDAGEWGHCEGVALSRYDQVVHDSLDGVLASGSVRTPLTGAHCIQSSPLIRSHLATPRYAPAAAAEAYRRLADSF
jgi:hypothetical protein